MRDLLCKINLIQAGKTWVLVLCVDTYVDCKRQFWTLFFLCCE